jgi:hypothetical protein
LFLKFSQNLLETGFVTENFHKIVQEINSKKKKKVKSEFEETINGIPKDKINMLNWYSLLKRVYCSGRDLTIKIKTNKINVTISILNELTLLVYIVL